MVVELDREAHLWQLLSTQAAERNESYIDAYSYLQLVQKNVKDKK
jgi:hypothetical protein